MTLQYDGTGKLTIDLYNTVGALIWQQVSVTSGQPVNLASLPKGVYLIRWNHPNGSGTLRFIHE